MKNALSLFLKQLRISNNELLLDMAKKLGVSTPFLSSVENGKKAMPETMFDKICSLYALSVSETDKLRIAVSEICGALKLDFQPGMSDKKKELAVVFARTFEELDDDSSEKITKYLKGKKEECP